MRASVAYCIDQNYLLPLAVSMRSLADTLNEGATIDVHILHSELAAGSKEKVISAIGKNNLSLRWHSVDASVVKDLPFGLHFSSANYFRLLLPTILPESIHVVAYVDADTIWRASATGLFACYDPKFELQACLDFTGTIGNPLIRLENPNHFGLSPDAPYFNSGLLLMNLQKWRHESLAEKILLFGKNHPEALWLVDQTAINLVLAGKIGKLPSHWNAQTVHPNVLSGIWQVPYLEQDLAGASLIHYTSEFKPWDKGIGLPEAFYFSEVRQKIRWG